MEAGQRGRKGRIQEKVMGEEGRGLVEIHKQIEEALSSINR